MGRLKGKLEIDGTVCVRLKDEPEETPEDPFLAMSLKERQAIWARVLLLHHRALLKEVRKTSDWAPLKALVRSVRGTEHARAVWNLLAWRSRRG